MQPDPSYEELESLRRQRDELLEVIAELAAAINAWVKRANAITRAKPREQEPPR